MNVSDEIRRIENELKQIKIQLSNTRQNESSHDNFIGLADTPASYVGETGKFPAVNAGENALEFRTAAQILAYLSAQAGAAFDWNAQNISNIGALACGALTPASIVGWVIGTDVQAWDADLDTYAGITPSANIQTYLGAADYAAMRTQLGLVIGTNVLAEQAIGIADDNLLEVDLVGGLIAGDITRATAAGLETRTEAQILAQLSGQATAAFDWNAQNLSNVGTIDLGGGQIAFPAAQNASADPNTQDDYEGGNWTPDVQFGGLKVGITYDITTGWYIKIGRQVFVTSWSWLSSKGSSNGTATIDGLPFAISNNDYAHTAASFRGSSISFADMIQAYGVKGLTCVRYEEITNAGVRTDLTDANFADNSYVMLSMTYFTD